MTAAPTMTRWTDHPRSRGVYQARPPVRLLGEGSSPLARGLQAEGGVGHVAMGIIPARAGFTTGRTCRPRSSRDHPRSRGVYVPGHSPGGLRLGSSPLARGLLLPVLELLDESGIIPARAGFTPGGGSPGAGSGDHPRSRGVYSEGDGVVRNGEGSSPLARGLLAQDEEGPLVGGIIPARAGFTLLRQIGERASTDHPRSRGVYPQGCRWIPWPPGSSPLARGLLGALARGRGEGGIIPARAGFTAVPVPPQPHDEDHPRSRGVYFANDPDALAEFRIIPARAGFTPTTTW